MPARDDLSFACTGLSLPRIAKMVAVALGLLFLNKLGLGGTLLFFGIVFAAMLAGSGALAFKASTLFMLGVCANIAFVPKIVVWTIARFVNLFTFSGRFLAAGRVGAWSASPPYLAVVAFCIAALACSLLSGYYVPIALLKLFNFWVGMTGLFACAYQLRRAKVDTTEWFVVQAIVVAALSALSLALGVGSNFRRSGAWGGGLYNLAFYHPNTAGPLFAQFILYLTCVLLFTGHRNRWICIPLIAFLAYCVSLAGSRTGAASLVVGLVVIFGILMIWKGRGLRRLNKRLSPVGAILLVVAALGGLVAVDVGSGGRVSRSVLAFVAKSGGEVESVTFDEAISSRKGVIELSYENFKRYPVTGIGFQVATTEYFRQNASFFYAPVEKGFLPTALLEETGILGTSVFSILVVVWLWHLAAARNAPGLVQFVALLFINLGEVSIFAMAGHGAYQWMVLFGGVLLGDYCFKPTPQAGVRQAASGSVTEDPAMGMPAARGAVAALGR